MTWGRRCFHNKHKTNVGETRGFFFGVFASVRAADPIAPPAHRHLGTAAAAARGRCLITLLFTFLRYATGNVFRPTKSHAGQTTTQQEGGTDRSDQPEYQESLSVSSCLETSSCAQRAQEFQVHFFDVFFPPLRSISPFPSERLRGRWGGWERIAILWQG